MIIRKAQAQADDRITTYIGIMSETREEQELVSLIGADGEFALAQIVHLKPDHTMLLLSAGTAFTAEETQTLIKSAIASFEAGIDFGPAADL